MKKSIVVLIFCAVVLVVSWVFLNGKETRISYGNGRVSTISIYCLANDLPNSFFAINDVVHDRHELKFMFEGDKIKDISYNYVGEFDSEIAARRNFSVMRAKYDTYMAKTPINQERLTPVFVVIEKSVNINLFFDENTFVIETAPLIFLDQANYEDVGRISVEGIKSIYEASGFSCKINQ